MIEKEYGKFILYCDICGEAAGKNRGFDSFYDAVDYKKRNGWSSEKKPIGEGGKGYRMEWFDICPECQE